MSDFLDLVRTRPVFYDGSMGATILNLGLTPEDYGGQQTEGYNDYLSVVKPELIQQIHASFLEVGADVIETNTFGSSVIKADEYGLGAQAYDINLAAAKLARRVADAYSTKGKPRFVAGSIGPSGLLPGPMTLQAGCRLASIPDRRTRCPCPTTPRRKNWTRCRTRGCRSWGVLLPARPAACAPWWTRNRWLMQLHIFHYPFYYIDYTLALCCALQFWVRSRRDPTSAAATA